ncbi:MAG: ABC transporter, partial [Dokdonella sp.]
AVLHDLEHVRHEYPQTLLLARELVAFGDTWRVLTSENLLRARQLVEQPGQDPAATVCHHRENKANSAP